MRKRNDRTEAIASFETRGRQATRRADEFARRHPARRRPPLDVDELPPHVPTCALAHPNRRRLHDGDAGGAQPPSVASFDPTLM